MALNIPSFANNIFPQTDSLVEAVLELEGKQYHLEQFHIGFSQEVDHKGKPQHETRGGQISVTLSQGVEDYIYDWAKRSGKRKDGMIRFQNQGQGTVLKIAFTNAYCISLSRKINAYSGTETTLVFAPEKVEMNDIKHDNHWRE